MEQDLETIVQLWILEYDSFKDSNNVMKSSDVYSKDEIPCTILSANILEQET
jgi:hypothetical protein